MAATATALLARYRTEDTSPQIGSLEDGFDALQIVAAGGKVLLNLDTTGSVNNPAVGVTGNSTHLGQFYTRLKSGATTAQLFADAFSNPFKLDIFQIVDDGGEILYWLNYRGEVDI